MKQLLVSYEGTLNKEASEIAGEFKQEGIAVLRVDDRGVGGLTGSVANSTSENFAADAIVDSVDPGIRQQYRLLKEPHIRILSNLQ